MDLEKDTSVEILVLSSKRIIIKFDLYYQH